MLKQRIKKIEGQFIHCKGCYKSWLIIISSRRKAQEQIKDIKARKLPHPNGGIYPEKDRNEFVIFQLPRPSQNMCK
jgi:hypothetical protein